jgi:hypothetical protein
MRRGWREGPPRQFGYDLASRLPVHGGKLLGGLQDVVIDIEGRAHARIITHHASDVNAGRAGELRRAAPSEVGPAATARRRYLVELMRLGPRMRAAEECAGEFGA